MDTPQAAYNRLIVPSPVCWIGTGQSDPELALLAQVNADTGLMMGENPRLPKMPAKPRLLDFFRRRFTAIAFRPLLMSAKSALDAGCEDKIVLACLLHDISNGCLL